LAIKITYTGLIHYAEQVVVPGDPGDDGMPRLQFMDRRAQSRCRRDSGLQQTSTIVDVGRIGLAAIGVVFQTGTRAGQLDRFQNIIGAAKSERQSRRASQQRLNGRGHLMRLDV
jgi:hypothetical protein